MSAPVPDLIASCWTAGGPADAHDGTKPSPLDLRTRIETAAAVGWRGFGLMHPDLVLARETMGLAELRQILDDNGILHLELEYLEGWWETGAARAAADRMRADLFAAVEVLRPRHIKVGAGVSDRPLGPGPLREGWAALCEEAAAVGVTIAIEAAPYSHLPTVGSMVELVTEVGHPSGGVLLDIWHVYRSGLDYDAMTEIVPPGIVAAVELSDTKAALPVSLREDTVDNRELCGEGDADVPAFIRAIDRLGFDGPWGVEIISTAQRARPLEEGLTRAYETTVGCFEQARRGGGTA